MTLEQKETQARNRYYAMTLTRILGTGFMVFGMMIVAGRFEGISMIVGYVLLVTGLIDIIVIPRFLARRWRTPPEA